MLEMECDALVITTNGFTKSNGEAVMGRGIAKQISDALPWVPGTLGKLIRTSGNQVYYLGAHNGVVLISYPVKPGSVINNGTNLVSHAKFNLGDKAPGFLAKAEPQLIVESAQQLVNLTDKYGWKTVLTPRFGCGAGELMWEDIKPLVCDILDDRFIACTF